MNPSPTPTPAQALREAETALTEILAKGREVKKALDAGVPDGESVHPQSAALTWPLSTVILALEKVTAALQGLQQQAEPAALFSKASAVVPIASPSADGGPGEYVLEFHFRTWNDLTDAHVAWINRNDAAAIEGGGEAAAPGAVSDEFCWLVELFLPTGNTTGFYHTGFTDLHGNSRSKQDPMQAKRYSKADAEAEAARLGSTLSGVWRAVQHGFHAAPVPPPSVSAPTVSQSLAQAIKTAAQDGTDLLLGTGHARELLPLLGSPLPAKTAERGTSAQILKERQLTCEAIQGAIAFGVLGNAAPPDEAAWLRPYYRTGALIAKWRHAADHLGLEGLASLADCADELETAIAATQGKPS